LAETVITAAREEHRYYPYQGVFYLARKSFWAAGQDSWTEPPAQNPDNFTNLTNVEPVLQGILERRRGYGLFSLQAPAVPYTLGYSFRNDLLGLREVIWTSPSNILVTTETGQSFIPSLFTPGPNAQAPRMVLSRNYGYFADGVPGDYKKFDGTLNALNVTKWGININDVGTLVFGPNDATTAADQSASGAGPGAQGPLGCLTGTDALDGDAAWNTPSNVSVAGQVTSTILDAVVAPISDSLLVTNFGFNIPSGATISGIVFSFSRKCNATFSAKDFNISVLQGGAAVGTNHANSHPWPTSLTPMTYGASTDLWGASWTPAQINASNFGLKIQVIDVSTNPNDVSNTISVAGIVTATVYYNVTNSPSWSNVNGSFSNNPASPATATATIGASSDLRNGGFGLAPTLTNAVTGIQVAITCSTSGGLINLNPILVKNGLTTGSRKTAVVGNPGFSTITFGGPNDLWGASWSPSDINGVGNFGVQYNVSTTAGSATFSVDRVQITIFTAAPPLGLGAQGSGVITLLSGRTYFYAFQNSHTGHTSSISIASPSTGPLTNRNQLVTGIPTCIDPQVDTVVLLATADGNDQTTLFLVASLANGTGSYTDNTPDTVLLTNPLYQDTDAFGLLHGVANNNPPPTIGFPTKHKGRIYGAIGSTLYFSKNLDEVTTANGLTTSKWEEAWPATNQLDISETAETIKGILSDGETLWIGTERTIRRLIGDSPQNFQKPEIQFNETGIFNQDVWRVVFYEGQPVGSMWLTPDLRVMSSDFNTYQDVGWEIQDVLNSTNTQAAFGPQASFVSKGPADYFMLYLPTGNNSSPDTVAVYNLRTKKWFIWQPTDLVPGSLFFIDASGQPRWLFSSTVGPIYEWTSGTLLDRVGNGQVSFPVTIQTSWLDFGDSNLRKVLNQLLYLGGDTTLSVQVEGAILDSELDSSSFPVLAPTQLATGPLQDLYLPMAHTNSKHRWYRFTFLSQANSVSDVLDGFSIEALGLFRY